jgi:hypothetical protein
VQLQGAAFFATNLPESAADFARQHQKLLALKALL